MLLLCPRETSDARLCWITLDDEVVGLGRILTLNHAVQAGETQLVDLAALRFNCVLDRAMAEFLRNQVLCTRSDAGLHVLSRKAERFASVVDTPQRNMGMRVFGVVVDYRYPFELGLKIALHPSH